MGKKHLFSAHSDLKTGFFCKFFLILGCILFVSYLILILFHPIIINDDSTGAILAFAILFIGFGVILYFFTCQFKKLSQIAEDIESDESLTEDEEKKESV
jgi:O-antigen/teichoic acid export membrane protein